MTATEFLLRSAISNPDVHTAIAGALNPAHLRENAAAARKGPLPAATLETAKRRLHSVIAG